MGDIDAILAASAPITKAQPVYCVTQNQRGRVDQFGLTKLTKLEIGAYLHDAYCKRGDFPESVTIDMTGCGMGKIIVNSIQQAMALHKKLTGESIVMH